MRKDNNWWRQIARGQGREEAESFHQQPEEPSFNERLKTHPEESFQASQKQASVIGPAVHSAGTESSGKTIVQAAPQQAASNEIATAAGKAGMVTQAAQAAAKGFKKIAESAKQNSSDDKSRSGVSSRIAIYAAVIFLLLGPVLILAGLFGTRTAAGAGSEIAEVAENELKRANEEGEIGGYVYRSWDQDTWNWLESKGIQPNWCANFVSWCAEQLGYCSSGYFPKTWGVYAYTAWFTSHSDYGEIHHHDTYVPERGDLVIYDWNGTGEEDHIEIVTEYDPDTGTMTSIGGNTGNAHVPPGGRWCDYSLVASHSFTLNASVIWGYIHPYYEQFTVSQTEEGN